MPPILQEMIGDPNPMVVANSVQALSEITETAPETKALVITPNTLNTRIKELREAGFVQHGGEGYCVTATGQDLLKRIADLQL